MNFRRVGFNPLAGAKGSLEGAGRNSLSRKDAKTQRIMGQFIVKGC